MRRTRVYGPAYLDRVLRVDRPLLDEGLGGPVDQGADAHWEAGEGLVLADPGGGRIVVELPADWPGPTGTAWLGRELIPGAGNWRREVKGLAWQDDLGGMGAGFTAALGGELIGPLGGEGDAMSETILGLLLAAGIAHRPVRIAGKAADWTLLVTSGPFGDKLPIGSRGLLEGLGGFQAEVEPCDLLVVASLNNRLAASALEGAGGATRMLAPTTRNMLDRAPPLKTLAERVDLLSCNRKEWEALGEDRAAVEGQVAIVAVTDGPDGALVRFARAGGGRGEVRVPAFPRVRPPSDTNRAGEAFAATLVTTLGAGGWARGPVDEGLIEEAARRASAAAALVLDREDFGFPTAGEIAEALAAGVAG